MLTLLEIGNPVERIAARTICKMRTIWIGQMEARWEHENENCSKSEMINIPKPRGWVKSSHGNRNKIEGLATARDNNNHAINLPRPKGVTRL